MNTAEILNSQTTKSQKMRMLFDLGMTRKEVAQLLGVGYGFVQNVYAKHRSGERPSIINRTDDGFIFDRTFGIELEIVHNSKAEVCRAIRAEGIDCVREDYNHTARTHWKIVNDASVHGGFEIVSPVLKGQDGLNQVEKVCRALNRVNAKITKDCGFHAHFGTNDFADNMNVWKNLYINYATLENEIDAVMPHSRRGNYYCMTMKVENWKRKVAGSTTLRSLQNAIGNTRYFKLNTQSFWRHKTVEFRQHSGTTDFEKIKNWLLFCARLINFSKQGTVGENEQNPFKKFLDEDGLTFYNNRKATFNRR